MVRQFRTAQNDLQRSCSYIWVLQNWEVKVYRRDGDDFRELEEKSNLTVVFHHNDVGIPKKWKNIYFRIVQEIVSNTLKHARAQRMDVVFLHQEGKQLHLRMVDDGIGFEQEKLERLSCG